MKNILTVSNMIYFVLVPLFYLWSLYRFTTLPDIKATNKLKKKEYKLLRIVNIIMITILMFIIYSYKFREVPFFKVLIKTKFINFSLNNCAILFILLPYLTLLVFLTAKTTFGLTPEDFREGTPVKSIPRRLITLKILAAVIIIAMSFFIIGMYLLLFAATLL